MFIQCEKVDFVIDYSSSYDYVPDSWLGKFFHDGIDVGSDPVCSSQISIEVKEAHILQLVQ